MREIPFSALLSNSAGEGLGDLTPILGSIAFNHIDEDVVLLLGPGTLHHCGVEDFLPPVEALDVGSVVEETCDSFPIFSLNGIIRPIY